MSCLSRLATKELLSVVLSVEDHTHCGGHVDDLSAGIELDVLSSVGTPVAIDVFQGEFNVWFGWVEGIVVVWLGNLANPGSHCHELFCAGVLLFEEWVFFHLRLVIWDVVLAALDCEALLLVIRASLPGSLITESLVVIIARGVSG